MIELEVEGSDEIVDGVSSLVGDNPEWVEGDAIAPTKERLGLGVGDGGSGRGIAGGGDIGDTVPLPAVAATGNG